MSIAKLYNGSKLVAVIDNAGVINISLRHSVGQYDSFYTIKPEVHFDGKLYYVKDGGTDLTLKYVRSKYLPVDIFNAVIKTVNNIKITDCNIQLLTYVAKDHDSIKENLISFGYLTEVEASNIPNDIFEAFLGRICSDTISQDVEISTEILKIDTILYDGCDSAKNLLDQNLDILRELIMIADLLLDEYLETIAYQAKNYFNGVKQLDAIENELLTWISGNNLETW